MAEFRISTSTPMSTEVKIGSTPSLKVGISPPLSPPCLKQHFPCSSWTLLSLYPRYSPSILFGDMCFHFGSRRGDLIIVHFGNHSLPGRQGWATAVRRRTRSFSYSPQQFHYKCTQTVFMFKALKMLLFRYLVYKSSFRAHVIVYTAILLDATDKWEGCFCRC